MLTLSLTVDATVELSLNSSTNGTLLTGHISDLKIKVDVVVSRVCTIRLQARTQLLKALCYPHIVSRF